MKYMDFFVQSLLLIVFLFFAILGAVSGRFEDAILWGLYVAMFLGPWQMLSCLMSIIFSNSFRRAKIIHFIVAVVYLFILGAFATMKISGPDWGVMLACAPAALLAVYYYAITVKWAFERKFNGRFLSHLNF